MTPGDLGGPPPTYADLDAAWQDADKHLKRSEQLDPANGLSVGAINELRNAGRHLADLLKDAGANVGGAPSGSVVQEQSLRNAIDHCKRATYDAVEIEILYYFGTIQAWIDIYGAVATEADIPGLAAGMANVNAVRRELTKERHATRTLYLDAAIKASAEISAFVDHIEGMRFVLNAKIEAKRMAELELARIDAEQEAQRRHTEALAETERKRAEIVANADRARQEVWNTRMAVLTIIGLLLASLALT